MGNTKQPILLRYGGAKKSSFEMNAEELELAAESIVRRAREKAFYKGLPIIYSENGNVIAEFSNGRVIKKRNNVSRTVRTGRAKRNW